MTETQHDNMSIERRVIKKIIWRVVPFLTTCYIFAILDRNNIGLAALQMNKDIGLSKSVFGFGSSLFFIAYFLFEIPSNIILQKVGARVWLARIMISWGLVAAAMALVRGPVSYGVVRFVLGAAEAGFFPGVLLYLTFWLPSAYRARVIALLMVAIPLSGFFGSQISGWLLSLDGLFGLRGWHWLFIAEGLPVFVLGLICLFLLTDSPQSASWLSSAEKAWLVSRLQSERDVARPIDDISMSQLLRNRSVWGLTLASAAALAAGSVLGVWQPQLIKAHGLTDAQTGILNSIPYGIASVLMIIWGWSSDKTNERRWHTCVPLILIAVGFSAAGSASSLTTILALLSCVLVGAYSFKAPFWALSLEFLSPRVAAVGLAGINAVGTLAGGLMVNVYGFILERTGSTNLAMMPTALMGLAGGLVILTISRSNRGGILETRG
ncbi:Putative tartrate transporter [Paraburkholderia nemoris]|uniref:MFS transporter n=1 Tax=Paraburkholderia nemoris TaxID=2793076 RepID=UPI00190948CB|nr:MULTISPECIES: MFS transporter [Paraburkholderia]MBK3787183.1 MFS transporter [Paraburkholderia aspalathi]CAE6868117.1 Putative tartrate transporter [Paraburkholderia nemoris]